jgi:amino acid permease
MNKSRATLVGLITGALMIITSLVIYYYKGNFENNLQYFTYGLYVSGIIYTMYAYQKSQLKNKRFKDYFSEGFKTFIVVTLVMVAFTWIFIKINPSLKDQMAENYRDQLIKGGNYTLAEINEMVSKAQRHFITMFTAIAIFGYLVIGALVSVIASLFFSQQENARAREANNNQNS